MHSSTLSVVLMTGLFAFLTAAAPAQDGSQLQARDQKNVNGMVVTIDDLGSGDDRVKREENVTRDGITFTTSDLTDEELSPRSEVAKRNSDYVSSCGPKSGWIPIADHYDQSGTKWWGYSSAVDAFCTRVSSDFDGNPIVVAPKKKLSATVRFENESDQTGTRVGLKNEVPGHIEFEIHNKQSDGDERPNHDSCTRYLMEMTAPPGYKGSNCYGSNNKDTKGGSYQVGSKKISYHGLPGTN